MTLHTNVNSKGGGSVTHVKTVNKTALEQILQFYELQTMLNICIIAVRCKFSTKYLNLCNTKGDYAKIIRKKR